MNSCLYRGTVTHARLRPRRNTFRYGIYFLYVDLDEIDELDGRLTGFSHNRFNLVALHDRDHGARDGSALRPWMECLLERVGISLDGGRVCLLTFPRVLGFRFCPVSFWYCFHADGTLRAVLAEVNNTFHQHHNYLLYKQGQPLSPEDIHRVTKIFHVSPFIQIENAHYQFRLSAPGDDLSVSIAEPVEGETLLVASIALTRRPLTDIELSKAVLRFGPMSLRALVLIHWQAVKLLAKGVRYRPKPELPETETSV